MRTQRTSLVSLFNLIDEVHGVKMNVEDRLNAYQAVVITQEYESAKFKGIQGNCSSSAETTGLLSQSQCGIPLAMDRVQGQ